MPASAEPMTRTFSSSAGASLASTSIPAASSGCGTQRIVAEPAAHAAGRDDRQAEDALGQRAVVARPDPGPTDAAGGQDERVGADAQRARCGLGVDGGDPPPAPLDVDHVEADLDPRAGSKDAAAKGLEQPEAGHRGRQARDLEDAVAQRPLGRGVDGGVLVEAKDGRQADPPRAGGEAASAMADSARVAPRRVLEQPGEDLRRDVVAPIEAGQLDLDRPDLGGPPGHAACSEVAGRVRRPGVSEAA